MNPATQGPRHEKRKYTRVCQKHGGPSFIDEPHIAELFVSESDEPNDYILEDVWLTPSEFEALPEFEGF